MSGKLRIIAFPFFSVLIFICIGLITDRDFFRYPLIKHGKGFEREKTVLLLTLRLYNKIFNDFQSSGGVPSLLNRFPAVKSIRHDVFRDIGYIHDAGRVLVYDMADMIPVDVSVTSPFTAEVVVLEQWNYQYQRRDNRQPVSPLKGLGRGIRYSFVREKGQWMVGAWDPVPVDEPKITDFRF